jgi:ABC-type sugar transport system ATPase subunit
VLRRGRAVGDLAIGETDQNAVVRLMVGAELDPFAR